MLGPTELNRTDCLNHIAGAGIARIAFTTPDGPQLVPVNYVADDAVLAVTTTPYSMLGSAARNALVAIEIDELDHVARSGWSVIVRGKVEQVDDVAAIARLHDLGLTPWAGGNRPLHLQVQLAGAEISGRVVGGV